MQDEMSNSQAERRATQILKHAGLYVFDLIFRSMVDNTVYLSTEEKNKSQLIVDETFGTCHGEFRALQGLPREQA